MSFEKRHVGETREVEDPSPYGDGKHEWSPYPEALDVGRLAEVAQDMIEQVADVEVTRERGDDGVRYDGPPLHPRFFVTAFKPEKALSKEKLDFAFEDQGRDALEEVMMVILQMGIEQGLRLARGEWMDKDMVKRALNNLEERRDELPDEYLDNQVEMIKNQLSIDES